MTSHSAQSAHTAGSSVGPLVRGSGPALVLAHGAGSDVQDSFGPALDHLALHHTVLGTDYPGSGRTPVADEPLTLDALADRVVGDAVAAGFETFAVSGFSMGTTVAVRAATRHPDRVTALVLSAGLATLNARGRLLVDTWRTLARGGDPQLLAGFLSLVVSGAAWLDARTEREVTEQVALFAQGLPPGTDQQLALLAEVDVRADLGRISVPTLVVSPRGDLVTTPHLTRELAAGIPGSRVVELDCGHAIAAERPQVWAELTAEFLAGN